MTKKIWIRILVTALTPALAAAVIKHFGWGGFILFTLVYTALLWFINKHTNS